MLGFYDSTPNKDKSETKPEICWNLCIFYVLPSKARNTHTTCGPTFREKRCFIFAPAKSSQVLEQISAINCSISQIKLIKCWDWDWFMTIMVVCLVLNKNHNLPHLKLKTNTLHLKRERERVSAKSRDNTWSKAKCPDSRRKRRHYSRGKERDRWIVPVFFASVSCAIWQTTRMKMGLGVGIMGVYYHQKQQHQLHLKQRRTCFSLTISSRYILPVYPPGISSLYIAFSP